MKLDFYNDAVKGKKGLQCKVSLTSNQEFDGMYLGEAVPTDDNLRVVDGLLMCVKLSAKSKEEFAQFNVGEKEVLGFPVDGISEIAFL